MPIQISKAVANVKVGPFTPPKRTLLDVPEGMLTLVAYESTDNALLVRKRLGSRSVSSTGADWGRASSCLIPDTLAEGLSAPGNSKVFTQVTVKNIPEYRIFLANSSRNAECRVLWFGLGGDYYTYDRCAIPDTLPYRSLGDYPGLVDEVLAKNIDVWKPTASVPYQILHVTDWVAVVAD